MPASVNASRDLMRRLVGKTGEYTAPATGYIGLSTADPGNDGSTNAEPSGGSYARVAITESGWADATLAKPSVLATSGATTFPTASATWSSGSNMTHFTFWRSSGGTTAADFIWGGALTTAKPVTSGDTASFASGALQLQLN